MTSSASRRDGILLYRPGRKILQIVPWLLGRFSFLPWHRLFGRRKFASFTVILPDFDLEKAIGPVDYATIYTGNGTAKSKFTLLVKLRGSESQRIIVKVGNTNGASVAIRHEFEVLKKLQGSELRNQVPRPLGIGNQGCWIWASQTVLPRGKSPNVLQGAHFRFLEQLKRVNVTHGDFTPWNCSVVNGNLVVWDWEEAGPFVDGKDITWFRKQVKELLGVVT